MLTKEKIKEILKSRIVEIDSIKIPHFSLLSQIDIAASRIVEAIKSGEKIVVVGDYDVDGVVSCSIMHKFLTFLNANFEIVIPNRFSDGYGLSLDLAKRLSSDLIITVDNGINSFEAADYLKSKNIDLIITDHHTPSSKIPNALAVVNPKTSEKFPFKEICGAEVAWYLCAAIKKEIGIEYDLRGFLDELAIAIIADVMPLTHLNRTLTQMGLKRLNLALKPFSKALKEFFNKEFDSTDIAFLIAPRLNAAGRIDSARVAFEFLISDDKFKAYNLLMELDELNKKRKELEKDILDSIDIDENDNFLVVSGDFHEGVIGIVASRLVNRYKKPAIVFSEVENGLKGSGRSLGNIDIYELIDECRDLLEGFGGHKMACGLKIKKENLKDFVLKLNRSILKYSEDDFFIEDFVLGELMFSEIDRELLEILKEFEPYGEANPKPKFITKAVVESYELLKDNHYKVILSQNRIFLPAVIFNFNGEFNKEVEFKFSIGEDYYGNIQLIIEELI